MRGRGGEGRREEGGREGRRNGLRCAVPLLSVFLCMFLLQVEVFDLKVIFSLLAEGPQISRDKLTAGRLLIENAHDKVHVNV